jgi:hypothetical protein
MPEFARRHPHVGGKTFHVDGQFLVVESPNYQAAFVVVDPHYLRPRAATEDSRLMPTWKAPI